MKRLLMVGGAAAMALLLSSCFVLQAFVIKKGALRPGDSTTIQMTVHPASTSASKEFQFVLIGVATPADLVAGAAVWGANGAFGGPKNMRGQSGLYAAVGTQCDSDEMTLSNLSGYTWKGYTTRGKVADKGAIGQTSLIKVALKAKNAAASGDAVEVLGVTGVWGDQTGDGVTGDDTFVCTGDGIGVVSIR
jgi:hypothetical protein